jgi:hypothetical protein
MGSAVERNAGFHSNDFGHIDRMKAEHRLGYLCADLDAFSKFLSETEHLESDSASPNASFAYIDTKGRRVFTY